MLGHFMGNVLGCEDLVVHKRGVQHRPFFGELELLDHGTSQSLNDTTDDLPPN